MHVMSHSHFYGNEIFTPEVLWSLGKLIAKDSLFPTDFDLIGLAEGNREKYIFGANKRVMHAMATTSTDST